MPYTEDEMLMLSGIQHYVFCPRQWALIHVDQQWHDNNLTYEGTFQHKNVDNPAYRGIVKNIRALRHVNLYSGYLGVYGISDIIELHETEEVNNAIFFPQHDKYMMPYPVEYKHGRPKLDNCDIMQLVCQVMCLEEMHGIKLQEAAIFYHKTKRREPITITAELRQKAKCLCDEMHRLYSLGCLPVPPVDLTRCQRCSLLDLCDPRLHTDFTASEYLNRYLYEKTS